MNDQTFDALQELADNAHDKFADLHENGDFAELEAALRKIAENVAERYSFSLSLKLEVFDSERGKSLQLLDTGIACSAGQKPYLATGDSTVQKYVVNGTMARVPHDYCPNCWSYWDFKLEHPKCGSCDCALGKEVKILLDTDICPNCEEGKVSMRRPKCGKCGFEVPAEFVSWG